MPLVCYALHMQCVAQVSVTLCPDHSLVIVSLVSQTCTSTLEL